MAEFYHKDTQRKKHKEHKEECAAFFKFRAFALLWLIYFCSEAGKRNAHL